MYSVPAVEQSDEFQQIPWSFTAYLHFPTVLSEESVHTQAFESLMDVRLIVGILYPGCSRVR